jgi:type I restriction enzyme, S subunit
MKAGWEIKKVGDIIKLEYGKPLPDSKRKYDGAYPVYGANGEKDRTDEYYYDKPSIIVGRKGSAGETNLTENKFWPLDVAYFVTFDDEKYDLRFIYYLLGQLELTKLAKGVKPGINRNEVYAINSSIPLLPEQQRIVAILDEAFESLSAAKAKSEKNLQNARDLFESYSNTIFAQRGKQWEKKKLYELSDVQSGGTPLRSRKEYWNGNIPWYSSGELNNVYTPASERFITEIGLENSNAKIFPKGSLLVGMYDTAAMKMSITDRDSAFNQAIAGIKPTDKIDLLFVMYSLNSFKPYILNLRRGVRQNNLSLEKIKNIEIRIPPLYEQRSIIYQLNSLSSETKKLEVVYQKKLADLEELKKSILHKAFAGELTRN